MATPAGAANGCINMKVRTGATEPAAAGSECGVLADVFRYQAAINPTNFVGRSPVTWTSSVAGNPAIGADSIGVNGASCPTCDFGARAVGNIDNDVGADEFYVGSQFGSTVAGACSEVLAAEQPGAAINTRNDVNCE